MKKLTTSKQRSANYYNEGINQTSIDSFDFARKTDSQRARRQQAKFSPSGPAKWTCCEILLIAALLFVVATFAFFGFESRIKPASCDKHLAASARSLSLLNKHNNLSHQTNSSNAKQSTAQANAKEQTNLRLLASESSRKLQSRQKHSHDKDRHNDGGGDDDDDDGEADSEKHSADSGELATDHHNDEHKHSDDDDADAEQHHDEQGKSAKPKREPHDDSHRVADQRRVTVPSGGQLRSVQVFDSSEAPNSNQNSNSRQRAKLVDDGRRKNDADAGRDICTTSGCVRSAAQVLDFMDNSTNPCDDFYVFACGNWIKQNKLIPDDKTTLSVMSKAREDLDLKLRYLLELSDQSAGSGGSDGRVGRRRGSARHRRADDHDDHDGAAQLSGQRRGREPKFVEHARNVYMSCMNLSQIEARGNEPLLSMIKLFGGWPVLVGESGGGHSAGDNTGGEESRVVERAATTTTTTTRGRNANGRRHQSSAKLRRTDGEPRLDWIAQLTAMRQLGYSHDILFDISVIPNYRNSTHYLVDIDQGYLGLPDRSYYLRGFNDSSVRAYVDLMTESAVLLGAADRQDARRQMLAVFEFETSMALISVPIEDRRNITNLYHRMSIGQLYSLAPSVDWRRLLHAVIFGVDTQRGSSTSTSTSSQSNLRRRRRDEGEQGLGAVSTGNFKPFELGFESLDESLDFVNVKHLDYVTSLADLIESTRPRVLKNFLIWRIVRQSAPSLGKAWRELFRAYGEQVNGRKSESPRWDFCMSAVQGNLEASLSALYVKNYFSPRAKEVAERMFAYIRAEFVEQLEQLDWMDSATKLEARRKALQIHPHIGHPNELLDDSEVESLYVDLTTSRDLFFENMRHLRILSTNLAFSRLRQPNDKLNWRKRVKAATVNAFYNAVDNAIEVPAGILQGNFFSADRPMYMNFGAIGYVIGHEITHGFDDKGRQFDLSGNNKNWWAPGTDAKFRSRAQCFIDQYSNFTIPENNVKLNGRRSVGENIADNGGIKQAFRAYRRWIKDNGKEARLPGLTEYSQEQMLFISGAQIWCASSRPEALRLRVTAGNHSPHRFRVLGPMSNSAEFAKAFDCPKNSRMNPSNKCVIW